ncbi:MAG: acyl-CoA dehydrogenase family protein [Pseudomonadota bacterium]
MSDYYSSWRNEELDLFRESVRRFIEKEITPNEERWRAQKHVEKAFWLKAGEAGFLCTDISEKYGCVGADFRYEVVLSEELAKANSSSWGRAVHSILANYIARHGTEDQKRRYLPKMARGEIIGALAMTEPGAGSDLQSIQTKAIKDGDDYVIDGSKTFITNGYSADLVGLACKTDPSERARGISLLLVETKDLEGFSVGKLLDKMGMKGQEAAELFFDGVRVKQTQLLGEEEGQGFYQLMADLPYERTMIMVRAQAAIEAALDMTIAHCKERQLFSKKLIELQNTRYKLAEAKTIATVGRVFIDHCIDKLYKGELDAITAAIGKLWLANMQNDVVAECLQLFGGYGYIMEYPIAHAYVDARVQTIYGGSNEVMKEIIARSL